MDRLAFSKSVSKGVVIISSNISWNKQTNKHPQNQPISGQIYLARVLYYKHLYTSLGGVYDMGIPLE